MTASPLFLRNQSGAVSMTESLDQASSATISTPTARWRAVAANAAGNFTDFFDWTIYSYLAPIFAGKFFSTHSQAVSLLLAFSTFAVGYLMRPIGGIVIGRLGDARGRRDALSLWILLMGLGSLGEQFPTATRGSGVSLGYAVAASVVGGTFPVIVTCSAPGLSRAYVPPPSSPLNRCWQPMRLQPEYRTPHLAELLPGRSADLLNTGSVSRTSGNHHGGKNDR